MYIGTAFIETRCRMNTEQNMKWNSSTLQQHRRSQDFEVCSDFRGVRTAHCTLVCRHRNTKIETDFANKFFLKVLLLFLRRKQNHIWSLRKICTLIHQQPKDRQPFFLCFRMHRGIPPKQAISACANF